MEMSSIQQLKKIYEALQHNKKVNLFGSEGVGKTWMAKRVSDHGIRYKLFDYTLWVFLSRYYNRESLSKSLARQLGLLPSNEEWEVEDDLQELRTSVEKEKFEPLIDKIRKKLEGRKILVILDNVSDEVSEVANERIFWETLEEIVSSHVDVRKVLISVSSWENGDWFTVKVEPLPREDSRSLLMEKLDARLRPVPGIQTLGEKFIEKSDGFPRTITMIAKVLNYFGVDASGVAMLEKELKEASEEYRVSKLLWRMPNALPIGVLKDFWWNGRHFFRDSVKLDYNELITYWILEGYLGSGSVTELYEKGHRILMELMDCGLLKQQEGGYIFMDWTRVSEDDLKQCNFDQIACLGLATVFKSVTDGFGTMTHDDGMLKTPRGSKKGKKNRERKPSLEKVGQDLSTLLLDGTHFSEKELTGFLEPEKVLEVLALFNPNIKSLVLPSAMMDTLRVLVLRGCAFLEDVDDLPPMKALRVLEISGGKSLTEMRPEIFDSVPKLQSLHLSELQITSLPQSIYSLVELRWLVVKDCPHLKRVKNLAKLKDLLVLDLSGNVSLDYVDKNFLELYYLQILNLSNTLVSTTPLLRKLNELTHLLLRGCKKLRRLPSLDLQNLQTLDLVGSTNFEVFHDPSLRYLTSLRTLDLSGTSVVRLPINIANPRYLRLKNCLRLRQLSCIDPLVKVEVLDLSGSKNLDYIEDDFFEPMKRLRVLNLSETNLTSVPSLSNLSDLRELLLSRCASLTKLPSLNSATKLEVLDVSQCGCLEDIADISFERMARLLKLDLSETKIKYLPTLSNPSNLRELVLKNCTGLKNLELNASLPNLEVLNLAGITSLAPNGVEPVKDMINLRVLDLSGTPIERLPSISSLEKLARLSLSGCKRLEAVPDLDRLTKLEVLDISGSSMIKRLPNFSGSENNLRKLVLGDCVMVEDVPDVEIDDLVAPALMKLPHGISSLSRLEYLEFPNISSEEIDRDPWSICRLSDDRKPPMFLSGIQFLRVLKKSPPPQGPFHLCAFPVMPEGETGNNHPRRHELVFPDVYLRSREFSERNRSLQIRGFDRFPKGIDDIIDHVDFVFLIDNTLKTLLSRLSVSVLEKLKGCWIERCHEIVTIFDHDETKDNPKSGLIALENLGISNNRRFTSIYNGKQPIGWFNNLKTLYLDGCPLVSTVFPSSWLPKTLKVLEIKHCDKIVSLSDSDTELEFPFLESLHLRELPELKTIGVSFPSLQTLKICECPKVKQVEEDFEFAKDLKTLWISGATSLESLYNGNVNGLHFPLRNIEVIKIRSCEKLRTLFAHRNSVDHELRYLKTLHLEDLPMLESVGVGLPSLRERRIFECPNLRFDGTIDDRD